jgi:hypothetical protein
MPDTYRACASSYAVFTVICGIALSVSIAALVKTGHQSLWQSIALCAAAWAFAVVWLSRYRLEISAESISYASLFSRERRIARSKIVSAEFADQTGRFESPLTFVIRTASGAEIRVNSKVFSRKAVLALVSLARTSRTNG